MRFHTLSASFGAGELFRFGGQQPCLLTNMGCKIFSALLLVVLLHFLERFAGGCSRRIKRPCAFGATPAPKTLFFDPYQFAAHGLLSTPRDWCGYALVKDGRSISFQAHLRRQKPPFSLP